MNWPLPPGDAALKASMDKARGEFREALARIGRENDLLPGAMASILAETIGIIISLGDGSRDDRLLQLINVQMLNAIRISRASSDLANINPAGSA